MPNTAEQVFPHSKERFEDRRKQSSDRKLLDEFFDHPTLLAISRLVSQGQFEAIDYPIATGKEGGVFRATSSAGYRAVKVYRIGNAIFRRIPSYAMEDLKREASARNFGRLVFAWTRREHSVLRKLQNETYVFDLRKPRDAAPQMPGFATALPDSHTLEIEVSKKQSLNEIFAQLTAHGIEVGSVRNKVNRLEELFVRLVDAGAKKVP